MLERPAIKIKKTAMLVALACATAMTLSGCHEKGGDNTQSGTAWSGLTPSHKVTPFTPITPSHKEVANVVFNGDPSADSQTFALNNPDKVQAIDVNLSVNITSFAMSSPVASATLSAKDTTTGIVSDSQRLQIITQPIHVSASGKQVIELSQKAGNKPKLGEHTISITLKNDDGATATRSIDFDVIEGITGKLSEVAVASNDGNAMIAAGSDKQIYVSNDGGRNWNAPKTGLALNAYSSVAISGSGQYMLAGSEDDKVYLSSDEGKTFKAILKSNPNPINRVAISEDGQFMAAGSFGSVMMQGDNNLKTKAGGAGDIFVSSDFGKTWRSISSPFGVCSLAMSVDGRNMIASDCGKTSGYLYAISFNGSSWDVKTHAIDGLLEDGKENVGISDDGQLMLAGFIVGDAFVSKDAGESWYRIDLPIGEQVIRAVSVSGNGQYLAVGVQDGRVFVSKDQGASWRVPESAKAAEQTDALAMSGNGEFMVSGSADDRVRISSDYGVHWVVPSVFPAQADIRSVSISDNGQHIAAATWGNKIYTSNDYGQTFGTW